MKNISTLKTPFYNPESFYSDHKSLSPLNIELIKDLESIISVLLPHNPPRTVFHTHSDVIVAPLSISCTFQVKPQPPLGRIGGHLVTGLAKPYVSDG